MECSSKAILLIITWKEKESKFLQIISSKEIIIVVPGSMEGLFGICKKVSQQFMKAAFLMNNSMGKGSLPIKLANMLVLLTMVRKKEGVCLRGEMGKDSRVITIVI